MIQGEIVEDVPTPMFIFFVIVGVIVLIAASIPLSALFGGFVIAYLSTHPPRKKLKRTPAQYGVDYEEVLFPSRDGVHLSGWFLPQENAKGAVILCHGMMSNRSAMLGWTEALRHEGFAVLLFDFRALGESGGARCTAGHLERLDLLGAIDYLDTREDTKRLPLGVFGFSMGGAAAILTAAGDKRISAVATHGAFATLERAIVQRCRRHFGVLGPLASQSVYWFGRVLHWFPVAPNQVAPLNAVAQLSPRPLLILHGALDPTVAPKDAQDLSNAAGSFANVHILPRSGHARIHPDVRDDARLLVAAFFARTLKKPEPGN